MDPALLTAFRQTLLACRDLYASSARLIIADHPDLLPTTAENFRVLMDDLHKGLVIKVYTNVSQCDRQWSRNERRLAEVLIEHVWQQRLSPSQLREAAYRMFENADELPWYSLVKPFDQIGPLRSRVGELETIVMRLANIVAKCDGELAPVEADMLRTIQDELHTHLRPVPLDEPGQHEAARVLGPQAVEEMQVQAQQVREEYKLPEATAPAADPQKPPAERLAEALTQLDQLVGLTGVKKDVRSLADFLKVQQQRRSLGLPETTLSLHMVLRGNPGTGKTSVARILAHIYGAMGVVKKGHMVETDRSGLVAQYAGQTGPRTNKTVDTALDGLLFVDEAYSLVAESGDDPYGHEAVQTLLKRMEDQRHRLIVVLAGYPGPMERLLATNPGLTSRFQQHMDFEDYSPGELGRIFGLMCDKNSYVAPAETQAKLLESFRWLYEQRDEHFSNGRLVRNIFESSIRNLATRVAGVVPITRTLLTVLEPVDVRLPGVPSHVFENLDLANLRYTVACPGCGSTADLRGTYLARRVKCKKCQHRFVANWGEPC